MEGAERGLAGDGSESVSRGDVGDLLSIFRDLQSKKRGIGEDELIDSKFLFADYANRAYMQYFDKLNRSKVRIVEIKEGLDLDRVFKAKLLGEKLFSMSFMDDSGTKIMLEFSNHSDEAEIDTVVANLSSTAIKKETTFAEAFPMTISRFLSPRGKIVHMSMQPFIGTEAEVLNHFEDGRLLVKFVPRIDYLGLEKYRVKSQRALYQIMPQTYSAPHNSFDEGKILSLGASVDHLDEIYGIKNVLKWDGQYFHEGKQILPVYPNQLRLYAHPMNSRPDKTTSAAPALVQNQLVRVAGSSFVHKVLRVDDDIVSVIGCSPPIHVSRSEVKRLSTPHKELPDAPSSQSVVFLNNVSTQAMPWEFIIEKTTKSVVTQTTDTDVGISAARYTHEPRLSDIVQIANEPLCALIHKQEGEYRYLKADNTEITMSSPVEARREDNSLSSALGRGISYKCLVRDSAAPDPQLKYRALRFIDEHVLLRHMKGSVMSFRWALIKDCCPVSAHTQSPSLVGRFIYVKKASVEVGPFKVIGVRKEGKLDYMEGSIRKTVKMTEVNSGWMFEDQKASR